MAIGDQYYVSVGADTTKLVASVNETITKMPTVKLNVDGSRVITQYKNITTATGEVFAVTQKTKQSLDGVISSLGSTAKQLDTATASTKKATTATKSMGSALDTASKSTKTLGQDFIETAGKVAKFGAITAILGLFTSAAMAAKDAIFDFDEAVTEFNKVTSLGSDEVNDYTIALGELGETVARTRTEMIGSATEFVRSGFTEEQSAQLAQIANLYTNIADTMVSSGDAASFVTSQVRAFQLSAEDAIVVVDSLNSISNNFGVSSSDLATGLTKNAAVLSGLGNEMSETMALFVGAGEQMPGQMSKISNGLRSIGLEISAFAQANEELKTSQGNVALFDNGELRSTYDIFYDLYPIWQKLNDAERTSIALDIGKKQQAQIVTATMNGFNKVIEANEVALSSSGSAMAENEKYMESLSAKINLIKASFEKLVIGDGGLTNFVKLILDATQALLDFANSGVGQFSIQVGVAIVALTAFNLLLKTTLALKIGAFFSFLTKGIMTVGVATRATNISLLAMDGILKVISAHPIVATLVALAAAYTFTKKIIDENTTSYAEQAEIADELATKLQTLTDRYNALKSESNLSDEDRTELEYLEAQIKASKILLAQEKEKELYARVEDEYGGQGGAIGMAGGVPMYVSDMEKQISDMDSVNKKIVEQKGKLSSLTDEYKSGAISSEEYAKRSSEIESTIADLSVEQAEYFTTLSGERNTLQEAIDSGVVLDETFQGVYDALVEATDATSDYINGVDDSNNVVNNSNSTLETASLALSDLSEAYSDIQGELDGMFSTYSDLSSMVDEYNSSNGASYENILELIDVADQYNGLLEFQDGQLAINTEAGNAYAQSKIDEAKATLTANTQKELEIILSGAVADAETDTAKQSIIAGEAILTAAQRAYEGVPYLSETTKAWLYMLDSVGGTSGITAEQQAQIDALGESYFTQMQLLDDLSGSVGKYSSATKGASDANDALKNSMDAFEDDIDAQIDALKDASDAIEDYYDDQIDHLKDLQDVEEAYWDAKIDALKEANEELEDQYELNNLLEAQASVSKSKVLSGGEWTYAQNEQDSADAQQALDKYYREQEYKDELDALEKSKANALAVYDKKIADLEKYKEQAVANYEQQIADLEAYKEAELANYQLMQENAEQNAQNISDTNSRITQEESDSYKTREENASRFVANYNLIMSRLNGGNTTGYTSGNAVYATYLEEQMPAHANGISSIKSDEIALVGDAPNAELVIGAKYNKSMGVPMNLQKGTGIIPAKETNTLTSMLTSVANNGNTYSPVANTNSKSVSVTISNLELPNVSNGDEFVDYLMNFETQMIQSSYNRG